MVCFYKISGFLTIFLIFTIICGSFNEVESRSYGGRGFRGGSRGYGGGYRGYRGGFRGYGGGYRGYGGGYRGYGRYYGGFRGRYPGFGYGYGIGYPGLIAPAVVSQPALDPTILALLLRTISKNNKKSSNDD